MCGKGGQAEETVTTLCAATTDDSHEPAAISLTGASVAAATGQALNTIPGTAFPPKADAVKLIPPDIAECGRAEAASATPVTILLIAADASVIEQPAAAPA